VIAGGIAREGLREKGVQRRNRIKSSFASRIIPHATNPFDRFGERIREISSSTCANTDGINAAILGFLEVMCPATTRISQEAEFSQRSIERCSPSSVSQNMRIFYA
jgi:hypothetical protein